MSERRPPITTHILDVALGRPAAGVAVRLARLGESVEELGQSSTDADGRAGFSLTLAPATYRLRFEVGPYFEAGGRATFYPHVEIVFAVRAVTEHYHVPLLLSPFGYSTYRGS